MAEYYLISQLPSLDGIGENMPLPITEDRFLELCNRFLGKKARNEMKNLTLLPPKSCEYSGSALLKAWNESERNLRLALGKVRAEKMKKPFDAENRVLPIEYTKVASTAIEMDNPMEAEKFLNRYRLELLETLRPTDNFSEDFVFYYGLKLKLILRIRQFDADAGKAAYKNIYNSILNGDRLEAM
ncbi:MAG: DUF2764 family protein [Oscillospiraceae bacterium]|nr:DUF2764 family protein [Oscillospiraceae bacterium]